MNMLPRETARYLPRPRGVRILMMAIAVATVAAALLAVTLG
ncbi:hypothetical protein ACX6XY_12160 [Streptomyces sp. O3]